MSHPPPYELVDLGRGIHGVHSRRYNETCHPIIGPGEEARRLYVDGLNLTSRLAAHGPVPFVIWDVGMGSAANPLAVIQALSEIPAGIQVISVDQTDDALRFALRHIDKLPYLKGFASESQTLIDQGSTAFTRNRLQVQWRFIKADFRTALASPQARQWPTPHAILFDPHSPARNPEMWTLPLLTQMHRLLDPARPAALSTYSRSSLVRTALLLAGFHVGRGGGAGQKEETTLAANTPDLIDAPLGRDWLHHLDRSSSAEPLEEDHYRQQPLSSRTRERLHEHPQFKIGSHGNPPAP